MRIGFVAMFACVGCVSSQATSTPQPAEPQPEVMVEPTHDDTPPPTTEPEEDPQPATTDGDSKQSGRLAPEVIQRVVRGNFGEFRKCYEQGLQKDPDLAGKVVVRFVISTAGKVSSASGESTTLPEEVKSCVVSSFRSLDFPQPDGGIVTVSYPIVFSPPTSGGGGMGG